MFLILVSILPALFGLAVMLQAKSAVHEIEALIAFLIAAVLLSTGMILRQMRVYIAES
jgi:hypothetical protein